jgi:cyclophilin family peptidyl-prolyl cis-trans isomerase
MASNPIVYFDVAIGERLLGRIEMELFANTVPRTAENFRALCTGERGLGVSGVPLHFKGVSFHRVISGFMGQCGDFTRGDGTGGESIYGKTFPDENFLARHDRRGLLSMANAGANTNGSQFFFTFKALPHLDGRHVVFGRVRQGQGRDTGEDVLAVIEKCATDAEDRPKLPVIVVDCGQIEGVLSAAAGRTKPLNEAAGHRSLGSLAVTKGADKGKDAAAKSKRAAPAPSEKAAAPAADAEAETRGMSPAELRLHQLRAKINQSRAANELEAEHEHRREKDPTYAARQAKHEQLEEARAAAKAGKGGGNSNSNSSGKGSGKDDKAAHSAKDYHLQQTAAQAEQQGEALAKKEARARAHGRNSSRQDVYHHTYEKLTRKLPGGADSDGGLGPAPAAQAALSSSSAATRAESSSYVYGAAESAAVSAAGLRRLESHMQEKEDASERNKAKRRKIDLDQGVAINAKNEAFNKATRQAFDKYTLEMRQSLERGSAV